MINLFKKKNINFNKEFSLEFENAKIVFAKTFCKEIYVNEEYCDRLIEEIIEKIDYLSKNGFYYCEINYDNNRNIDGIIDKLKQAGYKVELKEKEMEEFSSFCGYCTVFKKLYIYINWDLSKN